MEYLNGNQSINLSVYPTGLYDWMRVLAGGKSKFQEIEMVGPIYDKNGVEILGGGGVTLLSQLSDVTIPPPIPSNNTLSFDNALQKWTNSSVYLGNNGVRFWEDGITTIGENAVLSYVKGVGGAYVVKPIAQTSGGVTRYVDLTDVETSPGVPMIPVANQAIHYDATSLKWTQTPELKVDSVSRNIDFVTEGAIGIVNNAGSENIAIQAGGQCLVQSDGTMDVQSGNGNVLVRAPNGEVTITGDTKAVMQSGANAPLEIKSGVNGDILVQSGANGKLQLLSGSGGDINMWTGTGGVLDVIADSMSCIVNNDLSIQSLSGNSTLAGNTTNITASTLDLNLTAIAQDVIATANRDVNLTASIGDIRLTAAAVGANLFVNVNAGAITLASEDVSVIGSNAGQFYGSNTTLLGSSGVTTLKGDTEIKIDMGVNGVTFEPSLDATSVLKFDTSVVSAATYATACTGNEEYVPNVKYIDDAIAAIPSANITASNVGVAGVGVFKQKVLDDLEFKNINAASNKISVINDGVNNEIDIDVVPANIDVTALTNYNTLATVTGTQTLTNKSLQDNLTFFTDDGVPSKRAQFQCSGITTGATRTFTFPDNDGTLVTTNNCFLQGGNSFGVAGVIGTNDNQLLTLETNNIARFNLSAGIAGTSSFLGTSTTTIGAQGGLPNVAGLNCLVTAGNANQALGGTLTLQSGIGAAGGGSSGGVVLQTGDGLGATSSGAGITYRTCPGALGNPSGPHIFSTGTALVSTGAFNVTTGATATNDTAGSVGSISLVCGSAGASATANKNGGSITLQASRNGGLGNNGVVNMFTSAGTGLQVASVTGTRVASIDVSNIGTGNTRTYTCPNRNGRLIVCDDGAGGSTDFPLTVVAPVLGNIIRYDGTKWVNYLPPTTFSAWDDNAVSSGGTLNVINWIQGTYTSSLIRGFTIGANNEFTYNGTVTQLFQVQYVGTPIVTSNDRTIEVTAYKNPSAITNPLIAGLVPFSKGISIVRTAINDTDSVSGMFTVSLAPTDTIRMYVSNKENNDAVTMVDWRVMIKALD